MTQIIRKAVIPPVGRKYFVKLPREAGKMGAKAFKVARLLSVENITDEFESLYFDILSK